MLFNHEDNSPWPRVVSPPASYLPSPGAAAFQFVYVDELGEVCAVSPQFTFSAPKPLDELVTLEEERNGEEENEGDDLLLVVPRAHILQVHTGCKSSVW